jgi:hypothetical protein
VVWAEPCSLTCEARQPNRDAGRVARLLRRPPYELAFGAVDHRAGDDQICIAQRRLAARAAQINSRDTGSLLCREPP